MPTPPASSPALEARDVVREFGILRAVDGISFSLRPGEFLAVFGPNGAGKTSLLRLLAGEIRPTSGTVTIGGRALSRSDQGWRQQIGMLSHQSFLYDHLTAEENLAFYGRLFQLTDLGTRVKERLDEVGLLGRRDSRVRTFSRGMRQRLALARALLHDPEVVFLDAHAASLLNDVLASLKNGHRTVVLVTHNLSKGLRLADTVAIQVRGRFAWYGARSELGSDGFEAFYRKVVEGREGVR
jgi:heme exporter protein A